MADRHAAPQLHSPENEHDGPGWLNFVIVVARWNALKFIWVGPISLILLTRVRIQEALARWSARREAETTGAVQCAEASMA